MAHSGGEAGVVGDTDSKQCKLCRKQHASLARATIQEALARLGGGRFPSEYVACWERAAGQQTSARHRRAIVSQAAEDRDLHVAQARSACNHPAGPRRRQANNKRGAGRVHKSGRNGGAWAAWPGCCWRRRLALHLRDSALVLGLVGSSGVTAAFLFADIPTEPTGGLGWAGRAGSLPSRPRPARHKHGAVVLSDAEISEISLRRRGA